MASWRDSILADFGPGAPRLTLAADFDELLLDERIFEELRERGFDVVTIEDPIAFRFQYECRFRAAWDRGEATERRLVVRAPAGDLDKLPSDLRQCGRTLTLSLPTLFPELSYPILVELDRGDLDRLWAERSSYRGTTLGRQATLDFVLRQVYAVDPTRFRNASDVLTLLFRLHRSIRPLPEILVARLLVRLREKKEFADWPFDQIVPRREAFLEFLQERWPTFLQRLDSNRPASVGEARYSYDYAYRGPTALPFDDRDVRAEIQALFLDGALRSVPYRGEIRPKDEWVGIGIRRDPEGDRLRRLNALAGQLAGEIPSSEARYGDWIDFAYRWGALTVLDNAGPTVGGAKPHLIELRTLVDAGFSAWITNRYGGLYSQSPPPVMVSHIPRAIAAFRSHNPGRKVALVVVDGMAIDQWLVLRETLREIRPTLHYEQSAAFAWIPTITPVSRQAIFAGQLPSSFPSTIERTDRDESRWRTFWKGPTLAEDQIGYRLLPNGTAGELAQLDRMLENARLQILGLVVGTVDQLAHGTILGKAGLHNQVRLWAEGGFLATLINRLTAAEFSVVLTSDHGNVEAIGIGSLAEGALASTRGERVRVYSSDSLRLSAQAKFPEAIPWTPLGLPERYFPLLAPGRTAFRLVGEKIIGHGGLSLEEVIVPYVVVRPEMT